MRIVAIRICKEQLGVLKNGVTLGHRGNVPGAIAPPLWPAKTHFWSEPCCDSFLWTTPMDVKLILVGLTAAFTVLCLFFGTKNGFYDSDDYHGNGSAH
jgi:hypothetical protein